jgi:hypothetical protein
MDTFRGPWKLISRNGCIAIVSVAVRDGFVSRPSLLEKEDVCKNHLCTSGRRAENIGGAPVLK